MRHAERAIRASIAATARTMRIIGIGLITLSAIGVVVALGGGGIAQGGPVAAVVVVIAGVPGALFVRAGRRDPARDPLMILVCASPQRIVDVHIRYEQAAGRYISTIALRVDDGSEHTFDVTTGEEKIIAAELLAISRRDATA